MTNDFGVLYHNTVLLTYQRYFKWTLSISLCHPQPTVAQYQSCRLWLQLWYI